LKSEEAGLLARFGEEYEVYRRETNALIPVPSYWRVRASS